MSTTPTTAAPVIETRGATQRYGTLDALQDVDFSLGAGEVRALLGKNGAGKSTLIRLLTGVERPVAGTVLIGGELLRGGVSDAASRGVACVFQELSLIPAMTVADNYGLGAWPRSRSGGIDHRKLTADAQRALDDLGVRIDARAEVGSLSLAEQQMVEIARALRGNPRVLILDEPTSALAAREVSLVLDAVRRIAANGVAVLYVSHRMDEIRQIAESATVMRDGRLIDTVALENASTQEIVRLMLGEDADRRTALAAVAAQAADAEPGAPLVELRDVRIAPKVDGISLTVRAGEVLGIAGLQGSGRSELLRAIAGFQPIDDGQILVDGQPVDRPVPSRMMQLGIGMTPENRKRDGIVPQLGVDENVVLADYPLRSNVVSWAAVKRSSAALRDRLQIKTERLDTPIGTLSGGNQQKAVIGRWLHADSRVLLLDEPTRGVDVESKTQIYRLIRQLADEGRAVVFVSSELEELPLACDRVLVIRNGRVLNEQRQPQIDLDRLIADAIAENDPVAAAPAAGETR